MVKNIRCKICGKMFNKYGIKSHIFRAHSKEGKMFNKKQIQSVSKPSWNSGKTIKSLLTPEKYEKYIEKCKKGRKNCSGYASTPEKELIRRQKLRQKINERYAAGWEVKCGRAPKLDYISPIAGKIKLDGSWELSTAQYLDRIGVQWRRNKKRFKYFNTIKNRESTYCPDFFVKDWNTYIEVKGYETDLDRCKWSQFTEPLLIWKKDKINEIRRVILTGKELDC